MLQSSGEGSFESVGEDTMVEAVQVLRPELPGESTSGANTGSPLLLGPPPLSYMGPAASGGTLEKESSSDLATKAPEPDHIVGNTGRAAVLGDMSSEVALARTLADIGITVPEGYATWDNLEHLTWRLNQLMKNKSRTTNMSHGPSSPEQPQQQQQSSPLPGRPIISPPSRRHHGQGQVKYQSTKQVLVDPLEPLDPSSKTVSSARPQGEVRPSAPAKVQVLAHPESRHPRQTTVNASLWTSPPVPGPPTAAPGTLQVLQAGQKKKKASNSSSDSGPEDYLSTRKRRRFDGQVKELPAFRGGSQDFEKWMDIVRMKKRLHKWTDRMAVEAICGKIEDAALEQIKFTLDLADLELVPFEEAVTRLGEQFIQKMDISQALRLVTEIVKKPGESVDEYLNRKFSAIAKYPGSMPEELAITATLNGLPKDLRRMHRTLFRSEATTRANIRLQLRDAVKELAEESEIKSGRDLTTEYQRPRGGVIGPGSGTISV